MNTNRTASGWLKLTDADETEVNFLHRPTGPTRDVVIEYDMSLDAYTVMRASVAPGRDKGLGIFFDEDGEKSFYGPDVQPLIEYVDVTYGMIVTEADLKLIKP